MNLNIEDIVSAGRQVLEISSRYHNPAVGELAIDSVFMAVLSGRGYNVGRQHPMYLYGSDRPHRIDFRVGGNNPVVIELAVRSNKNKYGLQGPTNETELKKLCRVTQAQARLRVMLLLDLAGDILPEEKLKSTYDPLHGGRGRFLRSPVRVVYVHREATFDFIWKPFRLAV